MAIRYSDEYNKMIRRVVSNYNKRRKTAQKAGFKGLPEKVKVRELKSRYDKREDLNRELRLLEEFRKGTREDVVTTRGAKVRAWDLEYIKSNLSKAKEYFNTEAEIYKAKAPYFPLGRDKLNTILKNQEILGYDLENLTPVEYKSLMGAINSFVKSRNLMGAGYRGFLSEVDEVMSTVGIREEDKKKFFDKMKSLNNEEFFYMYENSELINRVYDLYMDRNVDGSIRMNASADDARLLIDTLMEEIDVLIAEAKSR